MALTNTFNFREHWGRKRVQFYSVAFDSSYPTGGESFTPADVGLGRIAEVHISPKSGYTFEFDYTNNKILVYSGATQVANTTNLSTLTGVRVMVIGS